MLSHVFGPRLTLLRLLLPCMALLAAGCTGTRSAQNPTLRVLSERGTELGVATVFGPVFLGRNTASGYVQIESVYGDGPSIESTVVEPVGGGLYTAETEIRLPEIPITFRKPRPGETVLLKGRDPDGKDWEEEVSVRTDERVYGILLDVPTRMDDRPDQIGAGIYQRDPTDQNKIYLIGLVSGRVSLSKAGELKTYLAVAGPETLWRLVVHRRDQNRRRPWVYREDIL